MLILVADFVLCICNCQRITFYKEMKEVHGGLRYNLVEVMPGKPKRDNEVDYKIEHRSAKTQNGERTQRLE